MHQVSAGCTITLVLAGPPQIRARTRILIIIILEIILQVEAVHKEDLNHLQDIPFRPVKTDRILIEVQRATLFLPETAWKEDQVIHLVPITILPQAAADLHHRTAAVDPADLTLQDLHQDLHQDLLHRVLLLLVVLQEGDSLKQSNTFKIVHSKLRSAG